MVFQTNCSRQQLTSPNCCLRMAIGLENHCTWSFQIRQTKVFLKLSWHFRTKYFMHTRISPQIRVITYTAYCTKLINTATCYVSLHYLHAREIKRSTRVFAYSTRQSRSNVSYIVLDLLYNENCTFASLRALAAPQAGSCNSDARCCVAR
jgi:hypothetical protein